MDDKDRTAPQTGKPQQEPNKEWNPQGSPAKEGQHPPKGAQDKPADPQKPGGPKH